MFYFKNQEQKRVWKEWFDKAKSIIEPIGQRFNKHMFIFTNFKKELVRCGVCTKYLLGIFYQGYKCEFCSQIAHRDCLTKTSLCTVGSHLPSLNVQPFKGNITGLLTSSISHSKTHSLSNIQMWRSVSFNKPNASQQTSLFCVQAVFRYDGRPEPPELPVVTFNVGDIILVTNDEDDCWLRGYVIKPNQARSVKEEGFFPSSYVKVYLGDMRIKDSTSEVKKGLEDYSWFARVDRQTAVLILNRIQNSPMAIFMVRCSQKGGYAVSIKFNGVISHIIIYTSGFFVNFLHLFSAALFKLIIFHFSKILIVSVVLSLPLVRKWVYSIF